MSGMAVCPRLSYTGVCLQLEIVSWEFISGAITFFWDSMHFLYQYTGCCNAPKLLSKLLCHLNSNEVTSRGMIDVPLVVFECLQFTQMEIH